MSFGNKSRNRTEQHSCPECGGTFNAPQQFLTMFETTIGPFWRNWLRTTSRARPSLSLIACMLRREKSFLSA
jgi:hypothetical protein